MYAIKELVPLNRIALAVEKIATIMYPQTVKRTQ